MFSYNKYYKNYIINTRNKNLNNLLLIRRYSNVIIRTHVNWQIPLTVVIYLFSRLIWSSAVF